MVLFSPDVFECRGSSNMRSTMEDLDFQVDAVPWWLPVPNASWRQPEGFDSGLEPPKSRFGDRWMHPAVHISWQLVAFRCGF